MITFVCEFAPIGYEWLKVETGEKTLLASAFCL